MPQVIRALTSDIDAFEDNYTIINLSVDKLVKPCMSPATSKSVQWRSSIRPQGSTHDGGAAEYHYGGRDHGAFRQH